MKILKIIVLLSGVAFTTSLHGAILSGNYTYNSISDLYTYSYSLDNTLGAGNITVLSVLISNEYDFSLTPESSTSPQFWILNTASGGNESIGRGTFFQWYAASNSLPPGNSLSGFSFTTQYAPSTNNPNNFGVFSDGNYIEFGYIVAPDMPGSPPLPSPTVPLPASMWLFLSGLIGIISMNRRKIN